MDRWIGFILIAISAASFGAMAIFARLAYDAGANPNTVLFLRFTIAAAIMLTVMAVRKTPLPRGRVLLGLVLMGAVGYVGQSFSYFTALTMASAGLVALLLYLYPALVTALAAVFLKERLTPAKVAALLMALTGTALTIGPGGGGRPLGIALGLAAAVIYAFYILAGSRIASRSGAIPASTVIMASAAAVYGAIVAVQGPHFPTTPTGWMAVFAVAVISTVVAIVTFFAGMERIGPTNASTLSTLEPVVTVVLAAIILKEAIGPLQVLGGAFILSAVVLLARLKPSKTAELSSTPGA